jgi:subtilisin-like proprotein convertase family protein/6-phosphogluconolactonase (cycloisomerase 2 family)
MPQSSHVAGPFVHASDANAINAWHHSRGRRALARAADRAAAEVVDKLEPRRLLAALSVNDVDVREEAGNSTATFTVTLDEPASTSVTVDFEAVQSDVQAFGNSGTANPTVGPIGAQRNVDFQATSGTLTFTPGQTSKTVNVTVLPDNVRETDEYFELTLRNAQGAELADSRGQAMIALNDLGPSLGGLMGVEAAGLKQAVGEVFERVRGGVLESVVELDVPLIGEALDRYIQPLIEQLNRWETDLGREIDRIVGELFGGTDDYEAISQLRDALFIAFGPSGLNVLVDGIDPGNGITASDVTLTYAEGGNDTQYLQYDFHLGQSAVTDIAFDIPDIEGLPPFLNFSLDADEGLRLSYRWDVRLGFGISNAYSPNLPGFINIPKPYLNTGPAANDVGGDRQKVPEFVAQIVAESAPPKDGDNIPLDGDFGFGGSVNIGLLSANAKDGTVRGVTLSAPNKRSATGDGTFWLQLGLDGQADEVIQIDVNSGAGTTTPLLLTTLNAQLTTKLQPILSGTLFPPIEAQADLSQLGNLGDPNATLPGINLVSRDARITSMTVFGGEEFGFGADDSIQMPSGVPVGAGAQTDDRRGRTLGFRSNQSSTSSGGRQVLRGVLEGPSDGRLMTNTEFTLAVGSGTGATPVYVRLSQGEAAGVSGLADEDVNVNAGERSLEGEVRRALRLALQSQGLSTNLVEVDVEDGRFVFRSSQQMSIRYQTLERSRAEARVTVDIGNRDFTNVVASDQTTFDRIVVGRGVAGGLPQLIDPIDFNIEAIAEAKLRLNVQAGVNDFGVQDEVEQNLGVVEGGLGLPEVSFDFKLDATASFERDESGSPTIVSDLSDLRFDYVQLDIGELFDTVVKPIVNTVGTIIDPVASLLGTGFDAAEGFITRPVPILSDLQGQDISLLDIAGGEEGLVGQLITAFGSVLDLSQGLTKFLQEYNGEPINFGCFVWDKRIRKILPCAISDTLGSVGGLSLAEFNDSFDTISSSGGGLKLDILNPTEIGKLLVGDDANLVSFTLPKIDGGLGADFGFDFGFIDFELAAGLDLYLELGIGYDTRGLRSIVNALRNDVAPDWADLLDGLYLNTRQSDNPSSTDPNIANPPEAFASVFVDGELDVDIAVASGRVAAGLNGSLAFNLVDPDNDGKLRWQEIEDATDGFEDLSRILSLFDIELVLGGEFEFEVDILFGLVSFDIEDFIDPQFEVKLTLNELLSVFGLDYTEAAVDTTPILAETTTIDGDNVLRLNTGPYAGDRRYGDTNDSGFAVDADGFVINDAAGDPIEIDGARFSVDHLSGNRVRITNDKTGDSQIISTVGIDYILATGLDGNDSFDFAGVNVPVEVRGAGGNDTLVGGNRGDTLHGDAGDDSLVGGDGNDRLVTGTGTAVARGGSGDDVIDASASRSATIFTDAGNDSVLGGNGPDDIRADGGLGNNTIRGGGGSDTLLGGVGDDLIFGGGGADNLFGGEGNDRLLGGTGVDVINGGAGDDLLDGGLGNDVLRGQDDNDTLRGGDGQDTLEGGRNLDLMFGGGGNDDITSDNADLAVEGGFGDDQLSIVFVTGTAVNATFAAGRYSDGNATTRINGFDGGVVTARMSNQADRVTVDGTDYALDLELLDGNDEFILLNALKDVTVDGGDPGPTDVGQDKVTIDYSASDVSREVTLDGRSILLDDGNTFTVDNFELVDILFGDGDDIATLNNTDGYRTNIVGGHGNDVARVADLGGRIDFFGGFLGARDDDGQDELVLELVGSPSDYFNGSISRFAELNAAVETVQIDASATRASASTAWTVSEDGIIAVGGQTLFTNVGADTIRVIDDAAGNDSLGVVATSGVAKKVIIEDQRFELQRNRAVAQTLEFTESDEQLQLGTANIPIGADVLHSPDGRHVYFIGDREGASTDAEISVYGRDDVTGELFPLRTYTESGLNINTDNGYFVMHPDGDAIAVASGDRIRILQRDKATGDLRRTSSFIRSVDRFDRSQTVAWSPDGRSLYAANSSVIHFSYNAANGTLSVEQNFTVASSSTGSSRAPATSVYATENGAGIIIATTDPGRGYHYFQVNPSTNDVIPDSTANGRFIAQQVVRNAFDADRFTRFTGGDEGLGNVYLIDSGATSSSNRDVLRFVLNTDNSLPLSLADSSGFTQFANLSDSQGPFVVGSRLVLPTEPPASNSSVFSFVLQAANLGSTNDSLPGRGASLSAEGDQVYTTFDPGGARPSGGVLKTRFGIFGPSGPSEELFVDEGDVTIPVSTFESLVISEDGTRAYAISKVSGSLLAYDRNPSTQLLRYTGHFATRPADAGLNGVSQIIDIDADNGFVVVSSSVADTLTAYKHNPSAGTIDKIGEPVATGRPIGELIWNGTQLFNTQFLDLFERFDVNDVDGVIRRSGFGTASTEKASAAARLDDIFIVANNNELNPDNTGRLFALEGGLTVNRVAPDNTPYDDLQALVDVDGRILVVASSSRADRIDLFEYSNRNFTLLSTAVNGQGGVSGIARVQDVTISSDARFIVATSGDNDTGAVFALGRGGRLTFLQRLADGVGGAAGIDGATDLVADPITGGFVATSRPDNRGLGGLAQFALRESGESGLIREIISNLQTKVIDLDISGLVGAVGNPRLTVDIDTGGLLNLTQLSLIAPSGQTVLLGGGSHRGMDNLTITDDAAQSLNEISGDGVLTGEARPFEPLSGFTGEDPNGRWRLSVTSFGSNLALNEFKLDLDPRLASIDVPEQIFDNQTSTSTLRVRETSGVIRDIEVEVDIPHTFVGDLTGTLIGPDGTRVTLFDLTGAGRGQGGLLGAVLDDDAQASVRDVVSDPDGLFLPTGILADFHGKSANGTWRLEVSDQANQDQGEIRDWSLGIETTAGKALRIEGSGIEGGRYTGGDASDEVVVRDVTFPGTTVVDTRGGTDRVTIDGTRVGSTIDVNLGSGDDVADVFKADGNVNLRGDGDSDILNLWASGATSNVRIFGGSGNDDVRVDLLNARGSMTLDGQSGSDNLIASTDGNPLIKTGPSNGNGTITYAGRGSTQSYSGFEFVGETRPAAVVVSANPISEGDVLNLAAQVTGLSGRQVERIDWDLDGDGVFGDARGDTPQFTWPQLQLVNIIDDGIYLPTARAELSDGTLAYGSQELLISDTAPTLGIEGPSSFDQFTTQTFTFTADDPGDDAIDSWRIFWGDGTSDIIEAESPTLSHRFRFPGNTTIVAEATDAEESVVTTEFFSVNVRSAAAPVRAATTVPEIFEGDAVPIDLIATGGDAARITQTIIDFDDGREPQVFVGVPGTQTVTYNEEGIYDVRVSFVEGDGSITEAQPLRLQVLESVLQITAELAGRPTGSLVSINEGDSVELIVEATKPGDDQVSEFRIDWGDGSPIKVLRPEPGRELGAEVLTHTYADNNTFAVRVTVVSEDETGEVLAGLVEVDDVAPVVTAVGDATINEGVPYTLTVRPSDPGDLVTLLAVDWGDGTFDTIPNPWGPGNFQVIDNPDGEVRQLRHVYRQDGNYMIRVAGIADGVRSDFSTRPIAVTDVAPEPTVRIVEDFAPASDTNPTIPISEGTTITAEVSTGEQGDDSYNTIQVDWGDGTVDTVPIDRELDLSLRIRGSLVTLLAEGREIGIHQFDEPIDAAAVGLAAEDGSLRFDDLRIIDRNGTPIYAEDFANGLGQFTVRSGSASATNNALVTGTNAVATTAPAALAETIGTAVRVDLQQLGPALTADLIFARYTGYRITWGDGEVTTVEFGDNPTIDDLITDHVYDEPGDYFPRVDFLGGTTPFFQQLKAFAAGETRYGVLIEERLEPGQYLQVDWGDGATERITFANQPDDTGGDDFEIDHVYAGPGQFRPTFVRFTPDANGEPQPGVTLSDIVLIGDRGIIADFSTTVDFDAALGQRGLLIFDYAAQDDYKFAGVLDTGGRREFVIGEIKPDGDDAGGDPDLTIFRRDNAPITQRLTHTYADNGPATQISARVFDAGTSYATDDNVPIQIVNVAPAPTIDVFKTVQIDQTFTLNITAIDDPGTDTVTSGRILWGDGTQTPFTGSPLRGFGKSYNTPGTYDINIQLTDEDGTFTTTTSIVVATTRPPQVVLAEFDREQQQEVVIRIDRNLGDVVTDALIVRNVTTGEEFRSTAVARNFGTRTATFTFDTTLPNGNYEASLPAAGIRDTQNVALQQDVMLSFFVLAGDANGDRQVNLADFGILRANFGRNDDPLFSQADFNYDGRVDLADFGILRQNFGEELLPPVPAPVPIVSNGITFGGPVRGSTSLFDGGTAGSGKRGGGIFNGRR